MELTNHLLKNNNENKEQNERDRSKNISLNIQEVECSTWDGCFMTFLGILLLPTIFGGIFILIGLFTVQPNESAVITRFGKYIGTVKTSGYHWINPFSSVHLVSLRQQNLCYCRHPLE